MYRLFQTHEIRKSREIEGLWNLEAGDYRGVITVPSCWEMLPSLATWQGKGIYTRELTFGGNARLIFKGVSHTADVYVDDRHIARHYNAYTPFDAVVCVPQGKHVIRVEVDNSFSEDSVLHIPNDYYTYGGIIRPVVLEELGDCYVSTIHFTPFYQDGEWHATVETTVVSLTERETTLELGLYLDDERFSAGEICLSGKGEKVFRQEYTFGDVLPYSPGEPKLYALKAVLSKDGRPVDDLIDRVGFREIRTEGKKLLLNGSPLRLRGFNRHEDYNVFGNAVPVQALMRDLALIRDTGANAIRTSHYPNDELFLDLCDFFGLMVWEEAHARGLNAVHMANPNFLPQSLNCIDEMIGNHYNHPCIFCWGILNECVSETEFGRECYGALFERIRSLDGSRPVTSATCREGRDITLDLQDIVSVNTYPVWGSRYAPADEKMKDLKKWIGETGNGEKPFIISEIGAGAVYGFRSDTQCHWSEEYQAFCLEKQLEATLSDPDISAVFIWQFCDIRVDDESHWKQRPKSQNNKGVVDEFRRKKLGYRVVKEMFAKYSET
ncbi:MAG: beta-glucuronidase [Ruminococcus flavefaciens]|nr:beta-glucuronidase [Ruminococcus flavefaciens]